MFAYLYLDVCPPGFQDPSIESIAVAHPVRPVIFDTTAGVGLPSWALRLPAVPTVYVTLGTVANHADGVFETVLFALPLTTSVSTGGNSFRQKDSLARPLVNEVLAKVTDRDHEKINKQVPTEDPDGTLAAALAAGLPDGPVAERACGLSGSALALAAAGLAAAAPVWAVAAAAIKLTSPGPVLYTSERIGRGGQPFRLLKFRTMIEGAEHRGLGLRIAANDDRITAVGNILRATSLDELPQLVNVLRGEMSLVGPRPTVRSQVERYTPEQRRRLSVRPGLTGWAQVNGRNAL
ncbi:MAG: sugar transferase, partial [Actinobacteria bacterium]|nr:sugar transferase [Actinomycetota bacterium]